MSHPFLQSLSEAHRDRLIRNATPFEIGPGGFLAREGEDAARFYLVDAGIVSIDLHVPNRGMVSIQTLGAGDVVGWSWIIEPHRWQFDARAIDTATGSAVDSEWLRQQCEFDHLFGYSVLKVLASVIASRLTATRLQCLDVFSLTGSQPKGGQ